MRPSEDRRQGVRRRCVYCKVCRKEFRLAPADWNQPFGGSKAVERHYRATGHQSLFIPSSVAEEFFAAQEAKS